MLGNLAKGLLVAGVILLFYVSTEQMIQIQVCALKYIGVVLRPT